jgi:hypothetical protein
MRIPKSAGRRPAPRPYGAGPRPASDFCLRLLASGFCLLASGSWLLASVDGVVMNLTTGKPQPAVIVSLVQPGSKGMQTLASVKSNAEGKFQIDKEVPPGPALLQGLHQGATYNLLLAPGGPTNGLKLNVYDSTAKPSAAHVAQDMVLLEPSASELRVSETVLFQNDSKLTYQDPANGSLRFYLPKAAEDKVQVTINAPGGMPIQRPAEKTAQPDVYKVNYPVKPGETRFDVTYLLPAADTFAGRNLNADSPTRLVTPGAVTLSGDGISSLGQEPQTQAHIYEVSGAKYEVKIEGVGSLRSTEAAAPDEDAGQPRIETAPARIYTRLGWVLGLTFAILALGGMMLYRKGAA